MSVAHWTDVVDEWIEALESGQYEQGKSYLQKNGQYCCLGVLCDIMVKKGEWAWDGELPKEAGYDKASDAIPGMRAGSHIGQPTHPAPLPEDFISGSLQRRLSSTNDINDSFSASINLIRE